MTVVSNTSPLSNLAAIAHIELLLEIYGTITIPTAVADELSRAGPDALGVTEVPNLAWIEIRPVTNRPLVEHLGGDRLLHLGEAEAIALAVELGAERLLMKEILSITSVEPIEGKVTIKVPYLTTSKPCPFDERWEIVTEKE
ncbi:MAG: DUF3368 domain-containing protein [Oscillatoria sp. SIO1A7]|nr:DUF3368 domain-containing protein [Oscillatoria sp. SIO1A7]